MKQIFLIIITATFSISVNAQSYKASAQKTIQQKLNDEYCTGLFKTTDGVIFDIPFENSTSGYLNILDWLEYRVAGLEVYQSRMGVSVPVIRGNVTSVYVDEMQVNLSYLNSLSIVDIAMIKVIKTPFYGGFNGAGGAIAIYTLRGEDEEPETDSR